MLDCSAVASIVIIVARILLVPVIEVVVAMVVLAWALVTVHPAVVVIRTEVREAISVLIVVLSVTIELLRSSRVAMAVISGHGFDHPVDTSRGDRW